MYLFEFLLILFCKIELFLLSRSDVFGASKTNSKEGAAFYYYYFVSSSFLSPNK